MRGYFLSCWHKLFCKRESVSNGVSMFVLIKYQFVQYDLYVTMFLPFISYKEIDTTAVHTIYWLHPLVLAVFGDIMLERAPGVRGLTLADSVPSLHCGLPADFLNCSCAINNVGQSKMGKMKSGQIP